MADDLIFDLKIFQQLKISLWEEAHSTTSSANWRTQVEFYE